MGSNDRGKLKSCTLNNVGMGNQNLTGVSEINAWLGSLLNHDNGHMIKSQVYAVRNGQRIMKTTILCNSW